MSTSRPSHRGDHDAPRVLFQLTGSIAAYKACDVISKLVQQGCEVQTVATAAALRFVGEATLEGLTGRRVATELFAPGSHMDHIHLIRWADVAVLCPATANTINRLAGGAGDDLIATLFLAHRFDKPYLLAPAMNSAMEAHPTVQRSLATLQQWGVELIESGSGSLACGEVGCGRLAEPATILAAISRHLPATARGSASHDAGSGAAGPDAGQPSTPLRLLLTAGGTAVPIDGVRAITNTSTGETGADLADAFAAMGHQVTLLRAAKAMRPRDPAIEQYEFVTFDDLDAALRERLATTTFDAVVHLAAVSDHHLERIDVDGQPRHGDDGGGKLDSAGPLTLHLRPNPKLLAAIREMAVAPLVLVGFKLTNGADDETRARGVAAVGSHADLVVHNDLAERLAGRHPTTIYRAGKVLATADDHGELARQLAAAIAASVTRSAS